MTVEGQRPVSDLEALARGAASGEAAAVDRWFRTEHPVVYRLCFGFLADAAEAEDAAQDAMMHLNDHLAAWDPARSYATWRTTVVLNLCRDRRRRSARRARAESAAALAAPPAPLPDPADAAQRREVRAILAAALAALPEREREVFVLRDLMGRPFAELAATLGVAESTVRTQLVLARRRLKRLLGPRLAPPCGEGVHG